MRLAGSAAAAGRREHLGLEERAYHPHLTLARARGRTPADLRPLVTALDDFTGATTTTEVLVTTVEGRRFAARVR